MAKKQQIDYNALPDIEEVDYSALPDIEGDSKKKEPTTEVSESLEEHSTSVGTEYTEAQIDTFAKFDQNPRLLMGATEAERKDYVDYKRKKTQKYVVTGEDRSEAKALLSVVD